MIARLGSGGFGLEGKVDRDAEEFWLGEGTRFAILIFARNSQNNGFVRGCLGALCLASNSCKRVRGDCVLRSDFAMSSRGLIFNTFFQFGAGPTAPSAGNLVASLFGYTQRVRPETLADLITGVLNGR